MTRRPLFACFLAFASLTAALPAAAAPADFSGTWSLDKSRSDTLGPMLEECGFSWIERKAAAAFQATVTIEQKGERVDNVNRTIVSDVKTRSFLDDKVHTVQTPMGPMDTKTKRTENGAAIYARTVTQCERNGRKMVMDNTRRFLKGTDEMELVMVVHHEGGKKSKIRRVFTRVKK